ncbi:MAG: transglycosylase SLT domain-containing protein [Gammaproteobacteria bacterium]
MPSRHAFVMAAALLLPAAAGAAAPAPADAVRAEFRAALDAAAQPQRKPDSAALRAYLLYPYVEAARLRELLSRTPAGTRPAALETRVQAFLARNTDEPVTRDIRSAWLNYLGERQAWPLFQAQAPAVLTDLAQRCHALRARIAAATPGALRDDALALWLTHRERPAACEPLFQWLEEPGRLTAAEAESRALFAARNRLRMPGALAQLPDERRALVQLQERLRGAPERELKAYLAGGAQPPLTPDNPEVAEALVNAFDSVARRESKDAPALFAGLLKKKGFSAAQRDELRVSRALGLAYDLDVDAVDAFDDVPDEALDGLSREWRVRSAMLHKEWRRALKWIDAMPPAQREEPRWRYFRARLIERNHPGQARGIYAGLAGEREYYGFLAAERLGQRPELRPKPIADDLAVQAELAALPAMRRAKELLACERPDLARAELRHALRERAAGARAQAARLVAGWDWHVPAVELLSELQLWDDLWLRYPRPFDPHVEAAERDTGMSGDWLYAVLRTESLYDARAVSTADALGLLQLLLPTARQVAQRAGLPAPGRDDLFRPEVNIALGARYLRELHARFRDRFIVTLAAYNAGPSRIPQWLPREPVDAEIWIENIPFNETRSYVQRTLANVVILGWRRDGQPAALLPLLAPLAPAAAAEGGAR